MEAEKFHELSLAALYACFYKIRKAAPELTLPGFLALLFIARETAARDWRRIPTVKKIAEEFGLTASGATRILEVLTERGRVHGVKTSKGLGLITSGEFLFEGRAAPYFLTTKGVALIKQVLADLAPGNSEPFEPYDEGALLLLAVAKVSKRAEAQD
ncbi:DNA-binding MarR family transcriptional regulator [Rhodoblastus acidophilus]|uniref:MarR family winged helix-turn-helix transcriptional regulator n=1 Tax=Rhodoblastus acidophilus TaxID=1074 RepID=UPI002224B021|nr:MarR family winged helix-turn-helix transcriptional regulator [Rhodoblastus acidophilus]MCW2286086.1 DNA-binding MarR family transcriptional regulator [Rhodoblastus acidophilus]MCW2334980.1 DNA-binding MarR family transcriptional regulator [Rhodoblastus acidophilus]